MPPHASDTARNPDDGQIALTLRLSRADHEVLKRFASRGERSLSGEVRLAIRRHIEAENAAEAEVAAA